MVNTRKKETEELLKSFHKLPFLRSHLDHFLKNCRDLSEKQAECFLQDINITEEWYQGWRGGERGVNFLADYCWCLKQDVVAAEHRRKSLKKPFIQ